MLGCEWEDVFVLLNHVLQSWLQCYPGQSAVSYGWVVFWHCCGARRPIGAHQEYRWSWTWQPTFSTNCTIDGAGPTSLLHITMNMNSAWVYMITVSVLECFHTPGNGSRNQADCSACNGSSDLPVRNLIVLSSVNTAVITLKTYLA